jgi:hypothetical protein
MANKDSINDDLDEATIQLVVATARMRQRERFIDMIDADPNFDLGVTTRISQSSDEFLRIAETTARADEGVLERLAHHHAELLMSWASMDKEPLSQVQRRRREEGVTTAQRENLKLVLESWKFVIDRQYGFAKLYGAPEDDLSAILRFEAAAKAFASAILDDPRHLSLFP